MESFPPPSLSASETGQSEREGKIEMVEWVWLLSLDAGTGVSALLFCQDNSTLIPVLMLD